MNGGDYQNIHTLENLINDLQSREWILSYIFWELLLIKELGFEVDFLSGSGSLSTVGTDISELSSIAK